MTVYLIEAVGQDSCKIGYARSGLVMSRLSTMQTGQHCELRLLGGFSRGDRKLEQVLHKHFARYWIRGEWFRDTERILGALCVRSEWSDLVDDRKSAPTESFWTWLQRREHLDSPMGDLASDTERAIREHRLSNGRLSGPPTGSNEYAEWLLFMQMRDACTEAKAQLKQAFLSWSQSRR